MLDGWSVRGEINIDRKETEIKNVAAVLEGVGPHSDETIVIAPITTTWATANPALSIPAHIKSITGPTTTPRAWRC